MDRTIDISGIDKAVLLASLFNHAQQVGRGALDERGGHPMSVEEARQIVKARMAMNGTYKGEAIWRSSFDYVRGRPVKVDIGGDSFDQNEIDLYDSYHGNGRLAQAVEFARNACASR